MRHSIYMGFFIEASSPIESTEHRVTLKGMDYLKRHNDLYLFVPGLSDYFDLRDINRDDIYQVSNLSMPEDMAFMFAAAVEELCTKFHKVKIQYGLITY